MRSVAKCDKVKWTKQVKWNEAKWSAILGRGVVFMEKVYSSQMKHQLDATLCMFYFCRVTLHVSGSSAHHISLLGTEALIRRCDDLPATITHVPVAAVLVLNTPDDGRLRPKHVQWLCRNKTCTVLHQVSVSFDLYYDARKYKIKVYRGSKWWEVKDWGESVSELVIGKK
jgi:hypothetical protein